MKLPTPIPDSVFHHHINNWLAVVKKKESVSIIGLTSQEQPYRINQLLNDSQIWKQNNLDVKKIQILQINLATITIEDERELYLYLKKTLQKEKQSIIFVLNADSTIREKSELLSAFNQIPHHYPLCSILFFFQTNIYHSKIKQRLIKFPLFYENRDYYSLYNQTAINHFLVFLEKLSNQTIHEKIKDQIINQCGGYLWFVREAMRYYLKTSNVKDMFNHEEMILRIQTIYDEFSVEEKSVLEKIVCQNYQLTPTEIEALDFLTLFGLVTKTNKPKITVPVLSSFIKQKINEQNKFHLNENGKLSINTVEVDMFFSRREKQLLRRLLQNRAQLNTRNTVANILWSNTTDEKYTDWALDQAIKRLRSKLQKLGLKEDLIKTIKNQGFIMIN